MPCDGPIARGLLREYRRLVEKFGDKDLLPIYEEKGVYNFYLAVEEKKAINAMGDASSQPSSASLGNSRQAHP